MRSAVPAELRQGGLGLLRALLAGRTRGAALTALLDARLEAENHFTLLTYAARHGQADAVRLLLESGASVGATTGGGSTALAIACQQGHLECVQLLLQNLRPRVAGSGPHARWTPLPTLYDLELSNDAVGRRGLWALSRAHIRGALPEIMDVTGGGRWLCAPTMWVPSR